MTVDDWYLTWQSQATSITIMLSPKRTKYRKHQKGSKKGVQSNTTELKFGRYGLKSLEEGTIQGKTIEAVRRTITRKLKRTGQVWIRIFPDLVVTRKPAEVRMGKGKGSPAFWVCRIQPGQILYEIDGVPGSLARQATKLAHHKLPIKTFFSRID